MRARADIYCTKVAPIFMKIALLQTGKTTEKHVSEGVEIYSARIRKYCNFEIITLPDLKKTRNIPVQEQKNKEGKRILQSIGKDDFVVLLGCGAMLLKSVEGLFLA